MAALFLHIALKFEFQNYLEFLLKLIVRKIRHNHKYLERLRFSCAVLQFVPKLK